MASQDSTSLELDSTASQASATTSGPSLPSAFGRMMRSSQLAAPAFVRDRCTRPEPTYNDKYNPHTLPPDIIETDYSPYVSGQPLYDDRAAIVKNLP
jgi:hypothetical protein